MTDPLVLEAWALALFAVLHLVPTHPPVRRRLVAIAGERGYQAVFALLAVGTLVAAVVAFNAAPRVTLWQPPAAWRHVAMTVNGFAFVLLACSIMTPNPTAAGVGSKVSLTAHAIFAVTRHPMMWAIGLWSLTHVVSAGHVAAVLLFGTIGAVALGGARHMEGRKRAERPAEWQGFAAASSFVPFAAILAGRARTTLREVGWVRIGVGVALFAAALAFHRHLSGVPLLKAPLL